MLHIFETKKPERPRNGRSSSTAAPRYEQNLTDDNELETIREAL